MMNKINNPKLLFSILFIILFILIFLVYYFVVYDWFAKEKFANEINTITIENENSIFKVHKILMYSSAMPNEDAESNSALENISITQYSDIALYLDNTTYIYDITDTNTIKELSISNIVLTTNNDDTSSKYLTYKNPNYFGKYINLDDLHSIPDTYYLDDTIQFDIINNNTDNNENDYNNPSFYADCSNPITLSYIHDCILSNYSVTEEQNIVSFNGKVLGEAGINLTDISYDLSFSINIVNMLGEKFICNFKTSTDLTSQNSKISSEGYLYTTSTFDSDEFEFLKLTTK